ncbi:MAG: PEP-CTERM sorting domain-containing protein, partial [Desertifilum sp. SIO1I2]|nr:PEP-CTERM sorting domain-containing protein [Desertifilum sp. SIO1I2]
PVVPQTEVPEPTSIVSLALIGLALSGGLKKRMQAA